MPVNLAFSVALLPSDPLLPRALDDRVGFFYLAYTDLGDHRHNTNITAYMRHESDTVDPAIRVRMSHGRVTRVTALLDVALVSLI